MDLSAVAYRAGKPEIAAQLWGFVWNLQESPFWERAACNLASLLNNQGHMHVAVTILKQVIELGEGSEVGWAALRLGILLQEQGDNSGASDAFALALRSGDPDISSQAAVALAGSTRERRRPSD
jgi:tetratricopeptide (TPR) repeat protein